MTQMIFPRNKSEIMAMFFVTDTVSKIIELGYLFLKQKLFTKPLTISISNVSALNFAKKLKYVMNSASHIFSSSI